MWTSRKTEVVKLEGIPKPEAGAPMPAVESTDNDLSVRYFVSDVWSKSEGAPKELMEKKYEIDRIAKVTFDMYLVYQFGHPNDEVLHGHPLMNKGLGYYGTFEVLNSTWIEYFEKINSVHVNHDKKRFDKYRHFIFTFHDSTLEVIAEDVHFEIEEKRIKLIEGNE